MTGKKCGRLTVISRDSQNKNEAMWICHCECGTVHVCTGASLRGGSTTSCGCRNREMTAERNRRSAAHGKTYSRTWNSWCAMLTRCSNPNSIDYKNYGGRGISVCERWKDFTSFLADMGERPPGTSLDRYPDKNGNYELGNCRWATTIQQGRNRRMVKLCEGDAERIRDIRRIGFTYEEIGNYFGVSKATARGAALGLTWKQIDPVGQHA